MEFDMVVEIPAGSRNKYEMDHERGLIRLDRMLFTATRYPADYGYIDDTLAPDGEPLDALVLTSEPTFPGVLICVRPIGVFCMRDEHGQDDKILCVPAADTRFARLENIGDMPEFDLLEIQHFFEVYKDLEPGMSAAGSRWGDRDEALAEIQSCRTAGAEPPRMRAPGRTG